MRTVQSALFVFVLHAICLAEEPRSSARLPRSTPESQGVSSKGVQAFVESADRDIDVMNSFLLVRHGRVVAEGWWAPYAPESRHSLYSLSKSFTSTAVGLAVAEGKLSVDDPVTRFFPEETPAQPTNNLKAMRVRDLLRMSTGHHTEPPRDADQTWTKVFLAHSVPSKPGTHFLYNTSATYMLSAIVQKATGQTVLDYLKPRLFEPLGIEQPVWGASPQGVTLGGYGLSIRTEEIARFGQLYLQRGQWNGQQLVPEAWVEQATSLQTSNGSNPNSDWDQGYGYQFWRSRHGAYRGDGAFGQYCIVLPEQDAVIAITSGVKNMQSVLDLVWDKLLPALKPAPLAPDEESHKKLERTLAGLRLPPQQGSDSSEAAQKVVGKRFAFPANPMKLESIALESRTGEGKDRSIVLRTRIDGVEQRIECGSGEWIKGRAALGPLMPDQPAAATAAWSDEQTLKVKICFHETPFVTTLTLSYTGKELLLDSETNVGFGPTKSPRLVGKSD